MYNSKSVSKIEEDLLNKIKEIESFDKNSEKKAQELLDSKMKPKGSLGVLEELVTKVIGITGDIHFKIDKTLHIVAASDNGIVEEGVSSCPIYYTKLVSESMLYGTGAIGILCKGLNIDFKLIDIGIKGEIKRDYPNLIIDKVIEGSRNFYNEPALTRDEVFMAIFKGIKLIEKNRDYSLFSNGEMGIGNTTTSSAILYSLTKGDINEIVGRGGGLSDSALAHKKEIIIESCHKYNTFNMDIIDILAHVGGLDICCMVGMYIGCGIIKRAMIIDGFISSVAALCATKISPLLREYMIPSHISEEPGMKIVMRELDLAPPLMMKMRLGEGTGAVFIHQFVRSGFDIFNQMRSAKEVEEILG